MSSPKPLRSDPRTSGAVRELLDQSASAKMGAADRAALAARLGSLLDAPAPAPRPAAGASWARWGIVGAVAAGVLAIGIAASMGHEPAPDARPAPHDDAPMAVETPPPPAPEPAPAAAPTAAPDPIPAPVEPVAARRTPHVRDDVVVPVVPEAPAPPVAEDPATTPRPTEIALLREARAALGSDPERTLAIIATSETIYPHGVFAEERDALAIDALSRAGRVTEARRRADAFAAAHPDSAHRAAIDERVP